MTSDNIQAIFTLLKNGDENFQSIYDLAEKLARQHNIKTPFTIRFKNLDYTPNEIDDIILSPGNIVPITINDRYTLECILEKKSPLYFKTRLLQALDRIHLLHRTLQHPVPLSKSISLRKDAKKWIRIPTPIFQEKYLAEKCFDITYTVTTTHKDTATTLTLSGKDPIELKRIAISRISSTILSDEELQDLISDLNLVRTHKPEYPINQISIGGQDGEIREHREY